MQTLYRANHFSGLIEEVDIISGTPAFVTLTNGRKEQRVSEIQTYHETREEAKQAILNRLLARQRAISDQIESIERKIKRASAL